jgi:hypothetical protein
LSDEDFEKAQCSGNFKQWAWIAAHRNAMARRLPEEVADKSQCYAAYCSTQQANRF